MSERTDTERLEWLATVTDCSHPVQCPKSGRWFIYYNEESRDIEEDTLRQAIDAAMDTEPAEGGG